MRTGGIVKQTYFVKKLKLKQNRCNIFHENILKAQIYFSKTFFPSKLLCEVKLHSVVLFHLNNKIHSLKGSVANRIAAFYMA